jgi:ribosomal protein S18 acetylase RimI-like enzyme
MNYDKYNKFSELHVLENPHGYLAWRYGTGDNVEIFDIEVNEKMKGHGTQLIGILLETLKGNPPDIVFGFTKQNNSIAQKFYSSIGFNIVSGIESHCLFWKEYKELYEKITGRKY